MTLTWLLTRWLTGNGRSQGPFFYSFLSMYLYVVNMSVHEYVCILWDSEAPSVSANITTCCAVSLFSPQEHLALIVIFTHLNRECIHKLHNLGRQCSTGVFLSQTPDRSLSSMISVEIWNLDDQKLIFPWSGFLIMDLSHCSLPPPEGFNFQVTEFFNESRTNRHHFGFCHLEDIYNQILY